MANQVALIGAIKLLADGAKDVVKALEPGQSVVEKVADFQNLIPDAMALTAVISDLKTEIAGLQPSDYASLAGVLVTDLSFSSPHAQTIAQSAVKLLGDVAANMAPDIEGFIKAVKG